MGSFSFLETGFFFTLAITFLLMLLLVYHFKQRLLSTEQKQDTMFEIINNLVHEFNNIKTSLAMMNRPPTPYPMQNQNITTELHEETVLPQSLDEIEDFEDSEYESDEESEDELVVVSDEEDNISIEELSDTNEITHEIQEHKEEIQKEEYAEEKTAEDKPDFSKMNLGNLKSYILKQGWVNDASKMKKGQILELIKEHSI